jgi:hypothetical protein
MELEYIIQPNLFCERNANYEKQKYITSVFTNGNYNDVPHFTCGNIKIHFVYDKNTSKFKIINKSIYPLPDDCVSTSNVISSALVLYRLLAIFGPMTITSDRYKSVWNVVLYHYSTKKIITLYDYKGAFSFGSEFSNIEDVPESLLNDIIELLNLICSDESPHPYDGCVAGSIA